MFTDVVTDDYLESCCVEFAPSLPLQPWEVDPYKLISWFQMLQFSARSFFWCGRSLASIKSDCYLASITTPGGQAYLAVSRDLDDKAIAKALKMLDQVEEDFRNIGLRITADTIKDVTTELRNVQARHNFQWLIDQVKSIEALANKELEGKLFLYIPPERASAFPRKDAPLIFGNSVAQAFPSAGFDIFESGYCLGLSRGTACVFHLMRVLEVGLAALGNKFNVSLAHTNWAPAIDEIERKIRNMHKDPVWKNLPDCKEQQEFYSQAASHFGVLKDAWRNYTMHVRGFYTEEQADRISENVKDFMQKLSTKLSESP